MYFNSPKDFTGFRDKPSGVVLLEECNVREVAEDSNLGAAIACVHGCSLRCTHGDSFVCAHSAFPGRSFCFLLSHSNGESVVLAAESENDMLEWMQAGACTYRAAPLSLTSCQSAASACC
eukprot:scaffold290013_cov36-Tisochrysis_lutea.AAC.1